MDFERLQDPAPVADASDSVPELVLFSAPGCSLCDIALRDLRLLQEEVPFVVRVVDISVDPSLESRYRTRIPVGGIGGRVVFKYRVDTARVRRSVCPRRTG